MADPYTGFPLPANITDNTSSTSGAHAGFHNRVETGLNELQATVTALEALVAAQAANITALQTAQALFSAGWTAYTPVLYNVTVGTGSAWGFYFKNGRNLSFRAGFKLGSGFTMSTSPLGVQIPFAAQVATDRPAIVTCYAQSTNVSWPAAGAGAILASAPDRITRIAGLGFFDFAPPPWNSLNPHIWAVGDIFVAEGTVELASV